MLANGRACTRLPSGESRTHHPPPSCSPKGEHIPHGMIFSCFMVSSMVGSAIAGRLLGGGSK